MRPGDVRRCAHGFERDELVNAKVPKAWLFRFVSAALAGYKKLPTSNTSSLPTAVLLPCTNFVSDLSSGEVTDYDLRVSILGRADAEGYVLVRCCRFALHAQLQ
jgi:hypothetical protein